MTFPDSPQAAFPVLRRILYDAFSIEAWLLQWPYANLDKIDRSIRRTLWGEDFTLLRIFPLWPDSSPFRRLLFSKAVSVFTTLSVCCRIRKIPM